MKHVMSAERQLPALDVVIAICTCRRPDGLLNLLHHLEMLEFDGSVSVVVIDNDVNKQGIDVCQSLHDYRWPITCDTEKQTGIAFARNTAVNAALQQNPRFIAMLDDDEWPSTHWLSELMRIQAMHDADAVGGPVLPVFVDTSNTWSNLSQYYGTDQQLPDGTQTVLYSSGNFLLKASCLQPMLPKPFDTVMTKSGADDMVFFRHLDKRGYTMHWAAKAFVKETVAPHRTNISWLKRRHVRIGNTNVLVQKMFDTGFFATYSRLLKTTGLLCLSSLYWLIMFWHHEHRIHSSLLVHKAIGKVIGHTGRLHDYGEHGGQ